MNDTIYEDNELICPMCEGSHGNNAWCQAPMEGTYDIF